ncbi:MAG: lipoprotein, partial [Parcubacteria group bacterium GW2011_GWA2_43_11]
TGCVWGAKPTTYTFATAGTKTLYAFARDAAGNISASRNDSVTITLQTPGTAPVISQVSSVPSLVDETPTYTFNSDSAGTIVYGGTCGTADKTSAVVGQNKITWTLANGVYSNCSVTVQSNGANSNTLTVPTFESTSKYPVVFVHGWLGNSTEWNTAKSYLANKGWKSTLLVANSITQSNTTLCGTVSPQQAQEVAGWVNAVLAKYPGFEKVDLVGHSRGGSNVMRTLWHGYLETSKVRRVVTMAGINRDCAPYYPAIPSDETPGAIQYSVYYSDGTPDEDSLVDYSITHVEGAYEQNLNSLTHLQMVSHSTALQAIEKSLLGTVGGNNNTTPPIPTSDTTPPAAPTGLSTL